jgi:predicted phage replisome organizer
MADVKWIKITTDIFDDEKILLIESLPDAYAIITVWFKLLCLAGKQNNSGVFMMGHIAYTDKMLATIFRMKEATVTMALQTFEQFGMVAIIDGVITIPNWGKHQNLDQLESKKEYMRNYMKDYREKQKALTVGKPSCKTNSKSNVSQADKEEDREIEKESDREKKRKRESRKKQNDIFTLFDNLYPSYSLSEILIEKMREWITYKAERNEAYAEQGMKSLLRQVKNKADEFGDVAVCNLIDECMSNLYKGIIFDKLKTAKNDSPKQQTPSETPEFLKKWSV